MIRLRTFGAVDIRDAEGRELRSLLVQPKRLALLIYLALAPRSQYRRRDKVVALFWPELDEEHARGALRQALSFLRRVLGPRVIIGRGEHEIGIDGACLQCDACAFIHAIGAGSAEECIGLYQGDFLDGFYVSDAAPEFQSWVDQERTALRRRAAECAWSLAQQRRSEGDHAGAASLARKGVALTPDDEREAARLIAWLDELGDRAGAIAAYEELAARLKSEYQARPAPETECVIRRVRDRTIPALAPASPITYGATVAHAGASRTNASRVRTRIPSLIFGVVVAATALAMGFLPVRTRAERRESAVQAGDSALLRQRVKKTTDLYARARYYWGKRGGPNLLKSIDLFTQALDSDPLYAPAWSGIADAYVQLGYASLLSPKDAFPKARAAAVRALALDSSLAEPHAALGFVRFYYDWDWAGAEQSFKKAITANARYATAHEWYGLFLTSMGRFDEAIPEERRAQELDPLSAATTGTAGWVLYYAGRMNDAKREIEVALRMDSTYALGHLYLGRILQAQGRPQSALAQYDATGPLRDWIPTVSAEAYVQAQLGRRWQAGRALARMDSVSRTRYVTAYGVALVHAALGDSDSAFIWLARAAQERSHWLVWLNRDPRWSMLRGDARFASLVRQVGLPP